MEKEDYSRVLEERDLLREQLSQKEQKLENLKLSNLFLSAIFNGISEEIMVVDLDFNIKKVNRALLMRLGLTERDVQGKKCYEVKQHSGDPCVLEEAFCPLVRARKTGKKVEMTHCYQNADGEEREVILIMYPLMSRVGKTKYFIELARDVTDYRVLLKKFQASEKKLLQTERLAAVGHSTAHVAHELKNPLMIIGGFSNQIKMTLDNDKDLKKLDLILEEVGRLERLVADLGDFTGEYSLLKRKTDINAVIKDVIKIMAGAFPTEKYHFQETLSPDVEEITCDPDRLKQVFINIITNGLEAMAEGGCLSITSERLSGYIEVRISDEGIGIPDEDLKHIFEPFYTTREIGEGLGLSISYKIIEAHKGDLSAVSRPGRGTTFIVQLPTQ